MEYRGDEDIIVAELLQVLFGLLLQCTDGCNVLHHVSALTIAHGDILHALLRCKKRFQNGYCIGDGGWYEGSCQGTEGFTVQLDALLFIPSCESVAVLPVSDGLLHRYALGIRNVIADAASFVGCPAGGGDDFT